MGNIATNTKCEKTLSPPSKASMLSFFKFASPKKSPTYTTKLIENNIIYGHTLQEEPFDFNHFLSCPYCKTSNFDEGLGCAIQCYCCSKYFITVNDHVEQIGGSKIPKSVNKHNRNINSEQIKQIPVATELSLAVCIDNLPVELMKEGSLYNYSMILEKIILPFFQVKERVVKCGEFFKIGNFEFKVLSTSPKVSRINQKTLIRCFKNFSYKCVCQSLVINCSNKNFVCNKTEILNYISNHSTLCHLNIGQKLMTGDQTITVLDMSPSDGFITTNTKTTFSFLPFLQSIVIAVFKDEIKEIFNKSTKFDSTFDQYFIEFYAQPFLNEFGQKITKDQYINYESAPFYIFDCQPNIGMYSKETEIKLVVYENQGALQTSLSPNVPTNIQQSGQEERKEGEEEEKAFERETEEEEKENVIPQEPAPNLCNSSAQKEPSALHMNRESSQRITSNRYDRHHHHHHHSSHRNYHSQSLSTIRNNPREWEVYRGEFIAAQSRRHLENSPINGLLGILLLERNNMGVHKLERKGASWSQISRLPERKIMEADMIRQKNSEDNSTSKCMVCLMEYEANETIRTMPCLHFFHKECLDKWLVRKKLCPICKTACDTESDYVI